MSSARAMTSLCLLLPVLLWAPPALADDPERRYTFSWPFTEDSTLAPRGGTTHGPELTLASEPSDAWQRLVAPDLGRLERDRRAILAMAGAYRTTFDFIETVGFTADYQPARPYQSWATEYVYVIDDQPRFISLQHVLVMTFVQPDGGVSEPMVVKHWRQDWRYEDPEIHVFTGHGRWQRRALPAARTQGRWSQAVFQVDDSPRYQAIGRWRHHANHSTWTSAQTWRPLPRRETSVRDDYHALVGTNRVTITPRGWIHEEDNLKTVLSEAGELHPQQPYLAREAGLNRYRHIVDYDFSAGDAYWRRTAPFWREVRRAWDEVFARHDSFRLRAEVDGQRLFEVMFALADELTGDRSIDTETARTRIAGELDRFVRPLSAP